MIYRNGHLSHERGGSIPFCLPHPPVEHLEHWIPLTPLEEMERTDYDVIIVGSGAGGGAVLWRLCDRWRKNGKRIALLERGDLVLPTHAINLPTFNQDRLLQFMENPRYKHRVTDPNAGAPIPLSFTQFVALGGRTIHWGTGSPRFHPVDFLTWPITYQDLAPYYAIAERVMSVNRKYTKGSYIQQLLLRRLYSMGVTDALDFPLAIGFKSRKNGLQLSAVFSAINFLGYALNVGKFDLAVNARVVEVLTERGSAAGVKVLTPDRRTHAIRGKTIVLAASTLENPRILLCSGIPGEAIGRYLVNHSSVTAHGAMITRYYPHPTGNLAILIPRTDLRPYQVEIFQHQPYELAWDGFLNSGFTHSVNVFMQAFGAVEPRMENGVSLDPNRLDEYGMPKMRVQFTYSQRDFEIIDRIFWNMQDLARGIELPLNCSPCLQAPGLEGHESGTCRMGNHPYTSVTNQFGELHHVSDLFVADSSVMPFIGGTNPTLTIVALAIRTADYIHFKATSQP